MKSIYNKLTGIEERNDLIIPFICAALNNAR